MPPVSPLTIGLAQFLNQQQAEAQKGVLQGLPQGVELLKSSIGAQAKANSTDPLTMFLLGRYVDQLKAENDRAFQLKHEAFKEALSTAKTREEALGVVAHELESAIPTGQGTVGKQAFDLTTHEGLLSYVNAALASTGKTFKTAVDIPTLSRYVSPETKQVIVNMAPNPILGSPVVANVLDSLGIKAGQRPQPGVQPLLNNPQPVPSLSGGNPVVPSYTVPPVIQAAGTAAMSRVNARKPGTFPTAASAVTPPLKDAAYYDKHREEFKLLPAAERQRVLQGR